MGIGSPGQLPARQPLSSPSCAPNVFFWIFDRLFGSDVDEYGSGIDGGGEVEGVCVPRNRCERVVVIRWTGVSKM